MKRCEFRIRQSQSVAWCAIEMHSSVVVIESHLLTQRARLRACVLARGRRVCVHERALHGRLVCVHVVCIFSRACVHVDVLCACGAVMCVHSRACVRLDISCACEPCACCPERACALTSRVLLKLVTGKAASIV